MIARGCYWGLLGVLLAATAGAQSWEVQGPLPTGLDIDGACFVSAAMGFASVTNGRILRTADGGATWATVREGNLTETDGKFSFSDSLYGWVAGSNGYLAQTTDGGQTWEDRDPGYNIYTNYLKFTSRMNGWLIGIGVLHTTDGGATWDSLAPWPEAGWSTASAACFTDSLNGWIVVHMPHQLCRTTDGGITWSLTPLDAAEATSSLYFQDALRGWRTALVIEDEYCVASRLYSTMDGGLTWIPDYEQLHCGLGGIAFNDALNGCVASRDGVLITTDGGLSWTPYDMPGVGYVRAVAASGNGHLWAFAEDGLIMHSPDNGQWWEQQSSGIGAVWNTMACENDLVAWAGGSRHYMGRGVMVRTTNGGAHWEALYPPAEVGEVLAIAPMGDGRAVAACRGRSDHGQIVVSDSGGQHWTVAYDESPGLFYDVACPDPRHAWAVGEPGICYSSNGGANSNLLHSPIASFRHVWFVDSLYGWASTNGQMIHYTTDGGATWLSVQTVVAAGFADLIFTDREHGWGLVGGVGGAMYTVDGGVHWNLWYGREGADLLRSVRFANPQYGWIGAFDGQQPVVYVTEDGGDTWNRRPTSLATEYGEVKQMLCTAPDAGWAFTHAYIVRYVPATSAEPQASPAVPRQCALSAAPNPFNPTTRLSFTLPAPADVRLAIYDVTGRCVRELHDGALPAGPHTWRFDGTGLASGLYFARLETAGQRMTQKLMLLR